MPTNIVKSAHSIWYCVVDHRTSRQKHHYITTMQILQRVLKESMLRLRLIISCCFCLWDSSSQVFCVAWLKDFLLLFLLLGGGWDCQLSERMLLIPLSPCHIHYLAKLIPAGLKRNLPPHSRSSASVKVILSSPISQVFIVSLHLCVFLQGCSDSKLLHCSPMSSFYWL